jgi:hypothetical protein
LETFDECFHYAKIKANSLAEWRVLGIPKRETTKGDTFWAGAGIRPGQEGELDLFPVRSSDEIGFVFLVDRNLEEGINVE